jgi:tetratricopeptide (TPR) repeat protein
VAAGTSADPRHAVRERGLLDTPADAIERIAWYYETAIALHPAFAEPHYNLATVCKRTGRTAEALRLYLRAAELAPHPHTAGNAFLTANAYWEAACLEDDAGRLEEAEQLFRQALRGHDNFGPEHRRFPRLLRRLGKLEEAADHDDRMMAYAHRYAPEFLEPAYEAPERLPRHADGTPFDPAVLTRVGAGTDAVYYYAHLYIRVTPARPALTIAGLRETLAQTGPWRARLFGAPLACSPTLEGIKARAE